MHDETSPKFACVPRCCGWRWLADWRNKFAGRLVCRLEQACVQPTQLDFCAGLDRSLCDDRHSRLAHVAAREQQPCPSALVRTDASEFQLVAGIFSAAQDGLGARDHSHAAGDNRRVYRRPDQGEPACRWPVRGLRSMGRLRLGPELFAAQIELRWLSDDQRKRLGPLEALKDDG